MFRTSFVLAAVLAFVAAACGGGGGSDVASLSDVVVADTAAAGGEAEPVDAEQALLDFTQCMRDNGIEIDDPTVDAEGNLRLSRPRNFGAEGGGEPAAADRAAARKAREQCAELLEGAALGFRIVDRTAIEDTLFEYASCMRDNGYDMADPDVGNFGPGAGPGGGPFAEIDRDDPAFVAADDVCRDVFADLPEGGPFGGGLRGGGGDG